MTHVPTATHATGAADAVRVDRHRAGDAGRDRSGHPAAGRAGQAAQPRSLDRRRRASSPLVVGVSAAAALRPDRVVGAGRRSSATCPADSVVYGEVRLDLPGDQRAELGRVPDASSRASPTRPPSRPSSTRSSTSSSPRRPTASRPSRPTSSRGSTASSPSPSAPPDGGAGDDGRRPADAASPSSRSRTRPWPTAWFDGALAETGATGTTETYDGTELTVFGTRADGRRRPRFAIVDGKVAVAGDRRRRSRRPSTPSGDSGFADDPAFAAAVGATSRATTSASCYVDIRRHRRASAGASWTARPPRRP